MDPRKDHSIIRRHSYEDLRLLKVSARGQIRRTRMRFQLRILQQETRTDTNKSKNVSYSETVMTWAEKVKSSPRYGVEAGEMFSDMTAEFNIRAHHEVKADWRVEDSDGVIYSVINVIPNEEDHQGDSGRQGGCAFTPS